MAATPAAIAMILNGIGVRLLAMMIQTPHCLKLTRFRGARQAFNGGFSDAQDASALFT